MGHWRHASVRVASGDEILRRSFRILLRHELHRVPVLPVLEKVASQHAIGITFAAAISGVPSAQGEAHAFRWFSPARLLHAGEFGFNQDRVVAASLAALSTRGLPPLTP